MIQELIKRIPAIHAGNKAKGFWEGPQNKSERVMLMITELSEAVEAHRKNKRFDPSGLYSENRKILETKIDAPEYLISWKEIFTGWVKDTVEDEIADAVIRILDYCGGFNIQIIPRDYRKVSTGNFAEDILVITENTLFALKQEGNKPYSLVDWGYTLMNIIKFCEWYGIDLLQHIDWKVKFNSTRPYKHNKAY